MNKCLNKNQRIPKVKSKMDNPENNIGRRQITCVGYPNSQLNTNNVNKTQAILQTTVGKHETSIFFMRKSQQTSQHGTHNIKTHNMTTQQTKTMFKG